MTGTKKGSESPGNISWVTSGFWFIKKSLPPCVYVHVALHWDRYRSRFSARNDDLFDILSHNAPSSRAASTSYRCCNTTKDAIRVGDISLLDPMMWMRMRQSLDSLHRGLLSSERVAPERVISHAITLLSHWSPATE
eukprot:Gregarina_sp_Poly_1__5971@NODE_3144_length_1340_cov_5_224666_g1998_i0_p1_GENE_NODE_3144_length_1340_cov_5_224666_g1998_i0NODE_3144_length_1340_cov_5_224666_g1998_i0_p1_ORF_typecomplete_len137_score6_81_NODE_3144_length_1340_cov_5_224666_g1998_i0259669